MLCARVDEIGRHLQAIAQVLSELGVYCHLLTCWGTAPPVVRSQADYCVLFEGMLANSPISPSDIVG
jgi:hypothetical protein